MPSLMASLGLNITAFQTGVNDAKKIARDGGRAINEGFSEFLKEKLPFATGVGMFVGIEEAMRRSVEWGEKVQDLSNRLGISTDAVQRWDHALHLNGSSMESAAGFFEKLGTARQKGLSGSEKEIDSFKNLGVSLEDLKSKRIEDIAAQIAGVFSAGDPQKLIGDLRAVGGRGAGELAAAFRNGLEEAVSGSQTELHIVSEHDIELLKEAGDETKTIWDNVKGITATFTAFAVSTVKDFGHDLSVVIHGAVGAFDGLFSKMADNREKVRSGKSVGFGEMFIDPLKAAATESSSLAHAYDDKYKAEEEAKKAKREKAKEKLEGGGEEGLDKAKERAANHLVELYQALADKKQKAALEEMTAAEKLVELAQRKKDVEAALDFEPNPEEAVALESQLLDIERERRQAKKQNDADQAYLADQESKAYGLDKKQHMFNADANSLQRIGAYSAAPEVAALDLQRKSEAHLQNMDDKLGEIVKLSSRVQY